jgi:hypothetical protein
MIWRAVRKTAHLLSKGHGPTNLFTLPIYLSVNIIEKPMGHFLLPLNGPAEYYEKK